MRILVTGGAGFIGSHLCERLLREGHHVICLDNFFTGSRRNVEHLLELENFEVLEHDVTRPIELDGLDRIYNLACPASPVHYQRDPVRTTITSVLGAINVLELARRTGARVLQASTSEVYGDPLSHPQPESYWGNVNPIGPRSCYDEGKRVAETLFFDYHRQYGVDVKVVRIFNTYGPRMAVDDGRVVSNFILQALRGEDLTVYGDGRQTRSFCYVDDMVEGIIRMMEYDGSPSAAQPSSDGHFPGPLNLGNPEEVAIVELAQMIIELTGARSRIVFRPPLPDDPARRRPDIGLARRKLGWEPRTPLAEGLRRTIAYYRALADRGGRAAEGRVLCRVGEAVCSRHP